MLDLKVNPLDPLCSGTLVKLFPIGRFCYRNLNFEINSGVPVLV